jgi:hypothetical protein
MREDSRQPDIIEEVKLKARLRNKEVLYSIQDASLCKHC